jgi:Arc/MetJ-type ribon-helix-helix transcriptional regulator
MNKKPAKYLNVNLPREILIEVDKAVKKNKFIRSRAEFVKESIRYALLLEKNIPLYKEKDTGKWKPITEETVEKFKNKMKNKDFKGVEFSKRETLEEIIMAIIYRTEELSKNTEKIYDVINVLGEALVNTNKRITEIHDLLKKEKKK